MSKFLRLKQFNLFHQCVQLIFIFKKMALDEWHITPNIDTSFVHFKFSSKNIPNNVRSDFNRKNFIYIYIKGNMCIDIEAQKLAI